MKSKESVFQYLAWGICAILAILLAILVFSDRKKNEERIIQAQQESQVQYKDTEANGSEENENVKLASSIYADLVSNLQLNSFICWGDNEMVGNTDVSLPKAFGETANSQLLNLLSEPFGEIITQEKRTVPSMSVSNMGVSNEGMDEILVRAGVDELEVGEWALIPGEKKPVNIVLRNGNTGSTLHFGQREEAEFGKAEISGVKGVLAKGEGEYDEDHPRIAFVRDRVGDSFQVGMGTDIEIESATKYIGSIPIFFFEDDSADMAGSVDEFMIDLERLVQRYTEIKDEDGELSEELPYVVICTVDAESELDESLKEAFGDRYIRHNTYADEMTEEDYKELAQKVYAKLDEQGCYDEMKASIAKAAEALKTKE